MWVEEEGEIFRKGQALLEPEDLESEFAGEQLRIEVGLFWGVARLKLILHFQAAGSAGRTATSTADN
jgi:hypothetical protein